MKIGFAQQIGQHGVSALEHFDQTRAVSVSVDSQAGFNRYARSTDHMRLNFRIGREQEALEGLLDVKKTAHAARASVRAASCRAASSSEHNSSRGGMLASRSIMVETLPKRRTAAPYNSQTGSGTGWS